MSKKSNKLLIAALILTMMASVVGAGLSFNGKQVISAEENPNYVELYSPEMNVDIVSANKEYLNPYVEDNASSPTGKALVLDYTPGHSTAIDLTIPVKSRDSEGFEGLAMWIDVPESDDSYSFTLFVAKNPVEWQPMNLGAQLTLVSADGKISTQSSMWKRQHLNGFKGWLILPKEAYPDAAPQADKSYRFVFMFEVDQGYEGDVERTSPLKLSIGTMGYYTDYDALLYQAVGPEVMDEHYIGILNGYVEQIQALKVSSEAQLVKKNKMLVYFSNIKENYKSLPLEERIKLAGELDADYSQRMQDFRYGQVKETPFVMSFAIASDTHFTKNWINENFLYTLEDAKELDPNLSSMFVLGDLSDNGIALAEDGTIDYEKSELDNYYDWRDSYQYKNSKGEQIPIISVMGNHDVRGPYPSYPQESYAPAVEYYIQREGGGALHWDKWINGYHFVFLNTDKYHTDNCYLSEETLLWLDKTLGEKEDGKPIFVMVHQPKGKVITMEGSSITFEEVIAKHPTAIVSSGHEHAHFGTAKIISEGEGVYINQPAMVVASQQYYFVEVYEGGVIYRARQAVNDTWLVDYDVVLSNADRRVNNIYSAKTAPEGDVSVEGFTASKAPFEGAGAVALKLAGKGSASITTKAIGEIENYGGYAFVAQAQKAITVKINGKAVLAGATYYALENGELVAKTAGANGEILANGWTVIPKEALEEGAHPLIEGSFTVESAEEQEILVNGISFYFNKEDLLDAIYNLSYSFLDEDGGVISLTQANYGDALIAPADPFKAEDQAYTYEFIGWDIDFDGAVDALPENVTYNVTAVAVYEATIKQYTVKFLDADGSAVLKEETLDYGSAIVAPVLDGLFGWDLNGDGAIESIPEKLTDNVEFIAVYAPKQYENATVVFDAGSVSDVNFYFYSYTNQANVNNLLKGYGKTREHEGAPGERVATFEYNYKPEYTNKGSVYARLYMPYYGSTDGFKGYAIWLDIPATTEGYIGGLRFNGDSRINPVTNGWTLIDSEGNVTYKNSVYNDLSSFAELGTGFTGWVLVDRTTFSETLADVTPNPDGYMTFHIGDSGRTTPYVVNIGQVLFYSDKEALIAELAQGVEKTTAMYTFTDGNGYIYKSGVVEKGSEIIAPAAPVHEDPMKFFAGWDTDFDGIPNQLASSVTITKNLNATAIFYHKEAFESIYDSTGSGFVVNSGLHTKLEQQEHASAPNGYATKISANPKGEEVPQDQHLTINIPEARSPKGIAVWLDCTGLEEMDLFFWINLLPTNVIADGGDYCYLMAEDGSVIQSNRWRRIIVPANFKGWIVMPMTTFRIKNLLPGDVLRIGIPYGNDYNPVDFSGEFYLSECVIFNCEVSDFMNQVNQRVYTFEDYDGTVIDCGRLEEGQALPIPANPERADYSFIGWDINGDGKADELPEVAGRNTLARAVYKSEKYFTYKFIEEDGTVILERSALSGSLILPPFRFEKLEGIYTYIPTYEGYEEGMILTENIEFLVTYTKEIRQLTYTFLVEGEVVKKERVDCGSVIVAPTAPEKEAEEHYVYEFAGWSNFEEGMTAQDDYIFEAIFNRIPKKYTYTFMVDGNVHATGELAYGEAVVLPANPVKESEEAEYQYDFSGWSGYTQGMTISGNVTFNAVFDKVVRVFTITFLDSDGVTVIAVKKVQYGSRVNPPAAPYKAGYEFVTWENYYGMAEVTEDASYKAVYKAVEEDSSSDSASASENQGDSKGGCASSVGGGLGLSLLMTCAIAFISRKKRANNQLTRLQRDFCEKSPAFFALFQQ